MTQEQIDLVLSNIAEIAKMDQSKAIDFEQIHQKTGIDGNELKKILNYLDKEGYIKNPSPIFDEDTVIYITNLGIRESLSPDNKEKNEEKIDLVLTTIANISEGNESKAVDFGQIRQKTGVDRKELGNILIYLGKEGYINNRHRVFCEDNEDAEVYITDLGINKCLRLSK